jgi:hypothetical protein
MMAGNGRRAMDDARRHVEDATISTKAAIMRFQQIGQQRGTDLALAVYLERLVDICDSLAAWNADLGSLLHRRTE